MKRSLEVEIKYQVLDPEKLISVFPKLPKGKINIDIYLDTKEGYFFQKGIFIRIRDNQKLDFKFNFEDGGIGKYDHTHCDEYSYLLPLKETDKESFQEVCEILKLIPFSKSLEDFISSNKLCELVIVEKERTTFPQNNFQITIDKLKNIGTFIEIEKDIEIQENVSKKEEKEILDKIKSDIRNFVSSLGLNVKEIKIGYCEIALKQKDYKLYKKGQYVLEEDRR